MTSTLTSHAKAEQGFTLVELLVVIMVLSILAALGMGAFLRQKQKGQDGAAKSNARNLVSQMHSCFEEEDGFVGCTVLLTPGVTNLPVGVGPGLVRVATESSSGYTIEATSKAQSGGFPHRFTITYDQNGGATHTCAPAGAGGCPEDLDADGLGEW